jgi:hypothetical protein
MQSANFTACARLAAVLSPPLPPVSAGALEHPALITTAMARAASGPSFLLIVFSLRVVIC